MFHSDDDDDDDDEFKTTLLSSHNIFTNSNHAILTVAHAIRDYLYHKVTISEPPRSR